MLKENERIDDLELNGLKIIQDAKKFRFGIDAVLLSDFAKEVKSGSTIVDLGAGTGIISILLTGKTEKTKIYSVEIQDEMAEMASRSVTLNNLQDRIQIINSDLKELDGKIEFNTIDAIVTNPPYQKTNTGKVSENEAELISRHEIKCTIADICEVSCKLLKPEGAMYIVHRPERLVDILYEMRKNKIEPKKIRFVKPKEDSKANLILIKGVKLAKPFLNIEKELIIYDNEGNYTKETLEIYGREK